MYKNAIENNSDIVICDMVDVNENGNKIFYNCTQFSSVYKVTPSACNKIFRKACIGDIRFLDSQWYEDLNFTTKILLSKPKISVISKPFYNCNVRTDSITNNVDNSSRNLDIILVINDLIKYTKENNVYDENTIKYLIFDHILITIINRVAMQNNKEKKEVIKKLREYCKINLKNYSKYEFYNSIPKSRKIVAKLNYYGLHNISKMLLNIKAKMK